VHKKFQDVFLAEYNIIENLIELANFTATSTLDVVRNIPLEDLTLPSPDHHHHHHNPSSSSSFALPAGEESEMSLAPEGGGEDEGADDGTPCNMVPTDPIAKLKFEFQPMFSVAMESAVCALAQISKGQDMLKNEVLQNYLAKKGVISLFVTVVSHRDSSPGAKAAALAAMVNVAHRNFELQKVLKASGVIEAMCGLLKTALEEGEGKDDALARAAAWCLMNLAEYHIHVDDIAKQLLRLNLIDAPGNMFKYLKHTHTSRGSLQAAAA
jgi:hypothetical protein